MHYGPSRLARTPMPDGQFRLSRALLERVWAFGRPYRSKIAALVATIGLAALVAAVPPLLYKAAIDRAIAHGRLGLLNLLALAMVAVAVLAAAGQVATRWLSSRIGEGLIFDLRVTLFDHIQHMPIAFFTRSQTGALTSRLTSDLQGGHRVFTETLAGVASTLFGVVVTVVAMLVLEWRLTVLALAIAPVFIVVVRRMRGRLHRLMVRQADLNAALSTQMTERFQVGGALLVKLFGTHGAELGAFGSRAGALRDVGVETAVYSRIFHVAFSLVAAVGTGLVFWLGGRMVVDHALTLGTIVAFSAYLSSLYTPITMLASARVELAAAMVSFQRVFEVLDFPPAVAERPGAVDLVEPSGRVTFEDVWFRYPSPNEVSIESLTGGHAETRDDPGAPVLRDVSFEAKPGQTVALVGPSGAGKTTISMLVPRLYDVTEGSVRVDERDVRDLTMESLARAVGIVTQDPHLFHDTIRHNLLYAKAGASEGELVDAARAAQIHDLIASLPDGYDTVVGERGYRLSGGEKQRLAIARLLLKDPAIMILDEATAHLDSESEVLIQQALAEAMSGRTALVIAHRLSTVVRADQILVVAAGRIVERGTHAELIEAGGVYESLYRIQFQKESLDRLDGLAGLGADAQGLEEALVIDAVIGDELGRAAKGRTSG
ncbi:MAG: ABC transporter ATP-binding protein [Actinomycetota bacterium]